MVLSVLTFISELDCGVVISRTILWKLTRPTTGAVKLVNIAREFVLLVPTNGPSKHRNGLRVSSETRATAWNLLGCFPCRVHYFPICSGDSCGCRWNGGYDGVEVQSGLLISRPRVSEFSINRRHSIPSIQGNKELFFIIVLYVICMTSNCLSLFLTHVPFIYLNFNSHQLFCFVNRCRILPIWKPPQVSLHLFSKCRHEADFLDTCCMF